MADLIAVDLGCLGRLALPDWQDKHLRALAERIEGTTAIFHPGHASYAQFAAILEGCKGEMPTATAVTAAEAMKPKPAPTRPGFPAFNGYDGSKRWRELHEELNPSPATVERVLSRVCPVCRPRARELLKRYPIDCTSLDAYRRSTVAYHDAVNAEVGNPVFGYEAAAKLYGW